MTELQQYLAEEVAEDHVDGIITRREAIRRLGLLGVGATAASAMLAAEAAAHKAGKKSGGGPRPRPRRRRQGRRAWAPVATEAITFAGPNGTLMAAWAAAAKPRGGVLVIHENRGLNDHIRNVAGRFAASGWSALALDLLSEEGGTGVVPGRGRGHAPRSRRSRAQPGALRRRHEGRADRARQARRRASRSAAIGFCFGGGMIWRLLAAREPRLSAAAPFYGPFPTGGEPARATRPTCSASTAGSTRASTRREDAAKAALEAARLDYELLTFTRGRPRVLQRHRTRRASTRTAAEEAWRRVIGWFDDADDDRGHGHGHGHD